MHGAGRLQRTSYQVNFFGGPFAKSFLYGSGSLEVVYFAMTQFLKSSERDVSRKFLGFLFLRERLHRQFEFPLKLHEEAVQTFDVHPKNAG